MIKRLGDVAKLNERYALPSMWRKIVGPHLAKHTSPKEIKNGILTLFVLSPTWGHHVNSMRHDIIRQVEKELGVKLRGIRVYNRARGSKERALPFYNEGKFFESSNEDSSHIFKDIENSNIRDMLVRVSSAALSRRKKLGGSFVK